MTEEQKQNLLGAINLLDRAGSVAPISRNEHAQVIQAVKVLREHVLLLEVGNGTTQDTPTIDPDS